MYKDQSIVLRKAGLLKQTMPASNAHQPKRPVRVRGTKTTSPSITRSPQPIIPEARRPGSGVGGWLGRERLHGMDRLLSSLHHSFRRGRRTFASIESHTTPGRIISTQEPVTQCSAEAPTSPHILYEKSVGKDLVKLVSCKFWH